MGVRRLAQGPSGDGNILPIMGFEPATFRSQAQPAELPCSYVFEQFQSVSHSEQLVSVYAVPAACLFMWYLYMMVGPFSPQSIPRSTGQKSVWVECQSRDHATDNLTLLQPGEYMQTGNQTHHPGAAYLTSLPSVSF